MQYFKDEKGKLFAFENDFKDIPEGLILASKSEIDAVLNPVLTEREKALSEIARLESEITPRRMREAVLGTDNGWLENQESLIAAERAKL